MSIRPGPNPKLQRAIDRALIELNSHDVTSDKYAITLERLSKLHKMKEEETPSPVSSDVLITVAAHLIGIAMIIRHEHLNVITSKALSFVPRPR